MEKHSVAIACMVLLCTALLVGCTPTVPQTEYDAIMSELETAQAEVSDLEAELASAEDAVDEVGKDLESCQEARDEALDQVAALEMQIQDFKCGSSPVAAWNAARQRHEAVMDAIPVADALASLAPWISFPTQPTWLEDVAVLSAVLIERPSAVESVCIVQSPEGSMLISAIETPDLVSMTCRGGEQDYQMTVSLDEEGGILKEFFVADETVGQLRWTGPMRSQTMTATYNGEEYSAAWPVYEEEIVPFFESFVDWMYVVNADGGMIRSTDMDMVIVGLGELRGPPEAATLSATWGSIIRHVASDFMCGVPQTCLL
ncbi:hypothetical protein ACFLUT_00975 [Chloroflexota bacterium]